MKTNQIQEALDHFEKHGGPVINNYLPADLTPYQLAMLALTVANNQDKQICPDNYQHALKEALRFFLATRDYLDDQQ